VAKIATLLNDIKRTRGNQDERLKNIEYERHELKDIEKQLNKLDNKNEYILLNASKDRENLKYMHSFIDIEE
jgi:hypothetical protein